MKQELPQRHETLNINLFIHILLLLTVGFQCKSDGFQCDNGKCIPSSLTCNRDDNCIDGSDEKYCACLSKEFKCENSGECISIRKVCDGIKDCLDESDENGHCCKFRQNVFIIIFR